MATVALPAVLAELFHSAKVIPATVSFVDIAGIVKGASTGEGLGNKFLANIRESDAICQVIRAFVDPDVVHVDGKVSPKDDIETINIESFEVKTAGGGETCWIKVGASCDVDSLCTKTKLVISLPIPGAIFGIAVLIKSCRSIFV